MLALGRCRRAGFAGGGWERERGGAEPGGGSPGPAAAGLCPRRAPARRGGGGAGPRPGEARRGGPRRGPAAGARRAWGRGVGPPPPRLGGSPAPAAAGTAGCLRPLPGWFSLWLRSARRARVRSRLPPGRGSAREGKGQTARGAARSPGLGLPSERAAARGRAGRPCPPSPAAGTSAGQVCVSQSCPAPGSARSWRGRSGAAAAAAALPGGRLG